MGWIKMRWGVLQVPNASINLPHEATFALDKVLKQEHDSWFLA
jgi:hypothetical protein